MLKVNLKDIPVKAHKSPRGKYEAAYTEISQSLGRDDHSPDSTKRHPFDLALVRLPPGAILCPYHAESAQWEMYLVVSGRGLVRHESGHEEVGPGDSFIFPPGEAHTLSNPSTREDFTYYVIANNPVGDSCYYPDSNKWSVSAGKHGGIVKGDQGTYYDGEE